MTVESRMVKYCPLCGAENPQRQPFCLKCKDCDLSTVPVESAREAPPAAAVAAAAPAPMAEPDPPTAAAGQTRRIEAPGAGCLLVLVNDPAVSFSVADGQCVGRTEASEVVLRGVPDADAISSRHARFFRRGDQWYVQHVGKTNFVKVDGMVFRGDEEAAIYEDSVVVLSLTAFRVKLEGATP